MLTTVIELLLGGFAMYAFGFVHGRMDERCDQGIREGRERERVAKAQWAFRQESSFRRSEKAWRERGPYAQGGKK